MRNVGIRLFGFDEYSSLYFGLSQIYSSVFVAAVLYCIVLKKPIFFFFGKHHTHEHTRARGGRT